MDYNSIFTLKIDNNSYILKLNAIETNPLIKSLDIYTLGLFDEPLGLKESLDKYITTAFGVTDNADVHYKKIDTADMLSTSMDLFIRFIESNYGNTHTSILEKCNIKSLKSNFILEFPIGVKKDIVEEINAIIISENNKLGIQTKILSPKKPKISKIGKSSNLLYGKTESCELHNIEEITELSGFVTIKGDIIGSDVVDFKDKSGKIFTFYITDYTNSITCKMILKEKKSGKAKGKEYDIIDLIKKGDHIQVQGRSEYDSFRRELVISRVRSISRSSFIKKTDDAAKKRIELHLHTKMSPMDGMTDIKAVINKAAQYGHKAIAITDHGIVQAFPDAASSAAKVGIKVIYGVECYLFDDTAVPVYRDTDATIHDSFVVFDLETTGLDHNMCKIIEIGAVKVENYKIVDTFSSFVNPQTDIPQLIIDLTGISNNMVQNAPLDGSVIKDFVEFCGDSILVAHNAPFDMSFLNDVLDKHNIDYKPAYMDTIELARRLLPEYTKFSLDFLCRKLNIHLQSHHRAKEDAQATTFLMLQLFDILKTKDISRIIDVNKIQNRNIRSRDIYHAILLVKNQAGLKNLYKLISISHLDYLYRGKPRIAKTILSTLRDGILIGSACEAGEVYKAIIRNKSQDELLEISSFYDYLEIQPLGNNAFMVRDDIVGSNDDIINANKKVIALGKELDIDVVATGDVHFLEPRDAYYRAILMYGQGFKDADEQAPLYYRTTQEMLDEFTYLSHEEAIDLVIDAPNRINDMIDQLQPLPEEKLYAPKIPNAEDDIVKLTYETVYEIYGKNIPDIVQKRLDKELNAITGYGYSVLYLIAHKLVKKSNEDGYLVGSRGSVGSSFVATMTGITEVNPLPPHYTCANCFYCSFDIDIHKYGCGPDLPNMICPQCSTQLDKRGYDIPFEVFLGFKGDKVPDIDLNFSGDNQADAHKYTEVLFGKENVFRAGTISTLASKTAYGFVKNYLDEKGKIASRAEINRLVNACVGVKKTTGQHPGGIIVVPHEYDIYDFCPIQHPADDKNSPTITTHFDFNSLHDRLVKLDILGHDDPTVLRMLHELTGLDPLDIPLDDEITMSLFSSTKALGIDEDSIKSKLGTFGIPEFGTKFVRGMLSDTMPTTMAELIRISGLSHGADVWLGNAQELIKNKTATLLEVICTRDDIMNALIDWGVKSKMSFDIMESVRKGKGLKPEMEQAMIDNKVVDWFINSCKLISYMFPKAHAVAYVTMGFRVAYYKVYYPLEYYCSYFTVRADDFDSLNMLCSIEGVRAKIKELEALGNSISTKDKGLLTIWELVLEMRARGYEFAPIDLYNSDVSKFKVVDGKLLPPLDSLPALGTKAAISICEARKNGQFNSINDLKERTSANKTVIAMLQDINCLDGVPESDQISIFDLM